MKIKMQLLDADYFLNNGKPVIRLFGKTEGGVTVCGFYDKHVPYFYAKPIKKTEEAAAAISKMPEIKSAEEVMRFLPFGYQHEKSKLLRLTVMNPQDVPKARNRLAEEGVAREFFEADILFKYRFMIDNGLHGLQWIEMDAERAQKTVKSKVAPYKINSLKPVDSNENAPFRYLAFDIECLPSDATKPIDAKTDPIVMIALNFRPEFRGMSTLVLVSKPFSAPGTRGFGGEKEMLADFLSIIDSYDPDIMTGYNVNSFDMPYIMERLRQNKLPFTIGRSDKETFSKAYGASQEHVISGRVIVDPYQILKRDPWMKLSRYDLKTVAKQMLGEEKHNVEYSDMPGLWKGGREGLVKFVEYSRKDAELSMKLLVDKGMMDKFFELAKISGLLLQDVFGGQTKRVETTLLHEFRQRGIVMPVMPSSKNLQRSIEERQTKSLKGATVLEPEKGLHAEGCVLVLDFKSLYPSIMRTYNISPDSVLLENLDVQSHKSPSGASFVDNEAYVGVFPYVLAKLLEARGKVKSLMKTKTGEEKRILNAKQLALKDMSNSFYGYTGYVRARLYMIDVANAVTAYGRENIEKTKKLVEENFEVKVVYGDTDSIFVKTKIKNLDEARELGQEISKFVTGNLPGYLELDFEKIYRTFLILTKKRYAGWKFDLSGGKWTDAIEMRGIETVRRDWCPLVSETMNDVLNTILKEGDLQKAISKLKEILEMLKKGNVPLEKLTVVKGITQGLGSYKGMLPHIEVARRMAGRDPQNAPKIGDRVSFVILKGNEMLSKRAEDPAYAEKNKLEIDSDYYIQSQLFPPIERIFIAVGIERGEILGSGHQVTLGEIFGRKSRTMKHEISFEDAGARSEPLRGWDGFVCQKCSKPYKRMTLQGLCACGGQLLISWQGTTGNKVVS